MNTKALIRTSILIALSLVAIIGIFSEPAEDSATWFLDFVLSKGLGFTAAYAVSRLLKYWSKNGNSIKE